MGWIIRCKREKHMLKIPVSIGGLLKINIWAIGELSPPKQSRGGFSGRFWRV
jgi:hypothetical protein